MVNLKDFVSILAGLEYTTFYLSNTPVMYHTLTSDVLTLDDSELMSVLNELSDTVEITSLFFDINEDNGQRSVYIAILDNNLLKLQQLNERRLRKIEQLNAELVELRKKFTSCASDIEQQLEKLM